MLAKCNINNNGIQHFAKGKWSNLNDIWLSMNWDNTA